MDYIIFDGNYILMKCVYTLTKMNKLHGELWNLLDNNISKYTVMNKWEKIIVVSDSKKKSWRKELLDKYKAHRVKDDSIDWEFVFDTYMDWKDSIREKYNVLEKDSIEGDDWIVSVIQYANKLGKSCVTISSDKDLYQLIKYKTKKKNSYINIQINDILGNEKVIIPIGWEIWLNEFKNNNANDVFSLDNSINNINFFNRILLNWNYEEIDCYSSLFEKIITGDKSDNIDSIYQKISKTGKIRGIGTATAKKMWDFYNKNYDIKFTINDEFVDDLLNCLEFVSKDVFDTNLKNKIKNNIKLNIQLIQLHYKNFPDWVTEDIIKIINENLNK